MQEPEQSEHDDDDVLVPLHELVQESEQFDDVLVPLHVVVHVLIQLIVQLFVQSLTMSSFSLSQDEAVLTITTPAIIGKSDEETFLKKFLLEIM